MAVDSNCRGVHRCPRWQRSKWLPSGAAALYSHFEDVVPRVGSLWTLAALTQLQRLTIDVHEPYMNVISQHLRPLTTLTSLDLSRLGRGALHDNAAGFRALCSLTRLERLWLSRFGLLGRLPSHVSPTLLCASCSGSDLPPPAQRWPTPLHISNVCGVLSSHHRGASIATSHTTTHTHGRGYPSGCSLPVMQHHTHIHICTAVATSSGTARLQVSQLTGLVHLHLEECGVVGLPSEVSTLRSLRKLALVSNPLDEDAALPASMAECTALQVGPAWTLQTAERVVCAAEPHTAACASPTACGRRVKRQCLQKQYAARPACLHRA